MFIAQKDGNCAGCSEPIIANISPIRWSRRNPELRGKFFHANCFPTNGQALSEIQEQESEETNSEALALVSSNGNGHHAASNGNGHHASENFSLAETLARALDPFMQTKVDEASLDERIQRAIAATMANVKPTIQTIVVKDGATIGKLDGVQHELFPKLMRRIALRQSCYLWGEAGSGKSTAAHKASDILGLPFYYLALQQQMTLSMLMGFVNGAGEYVPSDFFLAYTQGGVFLLDELELANGNLLGSLNGALANGRASFPRGKNGDGGMVKRHPDFVCIATGNTNALGASPAYSDRKALDAAVRDRFAFIEWNTDLTLELAVAESIFPDAAKWVNWVQAVRIAAKSISPRLIVTQRASIEGSKLIASGESVSDVANEYVFRGFDAVSVAAILRSHPLPTYKGGN